MTKRKPIILSILLIMAIGCDKETEEIIPYTEATIDVDAGLVRGEIDPGIYGHFIENLGRCIYGGLWEDEPQVPVLSGGIRKDVFEFARQLKPGIVRWPGGCFADGYHFIDGIGPRESRPVRPNLAWGGPPDPNTFGKDTRHKMQ